MGLFRNNDLHILSDSEPEISIRTIHILIFCWQPRDFQVVQLDERRAADPTVVLGGRKFESWYVIKGVILKRLGGRITSPPIEIRTRAGKKIPSGAFFSVLFFWFYLPLIDGLIDLLSFIFFFSNLYVFFFFNWSIDLMFYFFFPNLF